MCQKAPWLILAFNPALWGRQTAITVRAQQFLTHRETIWILQGWDSFLMHMFFEAMRSLLVHWTDKHWRERNWTDDGMYQNFQPG